MINNLIMAYRLQFYDLNGKRWKSFLLKNWPLLLLLGLLLLDIIIASVCSALFEVLFPMAVALFVELVLCSVFDRIMIKRYRASILSRGNHMNDVVTFLQTVVPGHDFFTSEQIDEIIQRLTCRIDESAPFKTFIAKLIGFGKTIILPAITCLVGAYAATIAEMDFRVIAAYAFCVIAFLGIAYIICVTFLEVLRKIICRDYDAAIALREDLQDIKLMFFVADDKARP